MMTFNNRKDSLHDDEASCSALIVVARFVKYTMLSMIAGLRFCISSSLIAKLALGYLITAFGDHNWRRLKQTPPE